MPKVKKANPYRNLTIYIPSRGRHARVETLRWLSPMALKNTLLHVHNSETRSYKNLGVRVLAHDFSNLTKIRSFQIRNCPTKYILIMDDDLKFFYRPNPRDWRLRPLKNFDEMIADVLRHVKKHGLAHASIAMREGSNRILERWSYNKRYARFLLFDTHVVRKCKLERVIIRQDFDVALQLIRKGFPAAVCYLYAQDQIGGSNSKGGCSAYRTSQVMEETALQLEKFHRPFVKLVRKKTKGSWGGGTRTDVMIYWKKAFESSGRRLP